MEQIEIIIVNLLSPAALKALGSKKEADQNNMINMALIAKISIAFFAASGLKLNNETILDREKNSIILNAPIDRYDIFNSFLT